MKIIQNEYNENKSAIAYELVRHEETQQGSDRAIDERLIITSPIDNDDLENFLFSRYSKLKGEGFKTIFIYAYPSQKALDTGIQWTARLEWFEFKGGVRVYFNDAKILELKLPDKNTQSPPVEIVESEKILTQEQVAQQKKASEDEQRKQEKVYKEEYAARSINNLKSNELLLAGAEVDIKNGNISSKMDTYAIGAILEVIYSTAQSIQAGWDSRDYLSPADTSYLKSMETRLSSFQQRALPKIRLAFKNRTKETLWVHDVNVLLSGSGNTVLTLYSFQFAANANIQAAQEQISDLVTKLRFKKIRYTTDEYANRGTSYKLDTPTDSNIAVYTNEFQKLDRKRNYYKE